MNKIYKSEMHAGWIYIKDNNAHIICKVIVENNNSEKIADAIVQSVNEHEFLKKENKRMEDLLANNQVNLEQIKVALDKDYMSWKNKKQLLTEALQVMIASFEGALSIDSKTGEDEDGYTYDCLKQAKEALKLTKDK